MSSNEGKEVEEKGVDLLDGHAEVEKKYQEIQALEDSRIDESSAEEHLDDCLTSIPMITAPGGASAPHAQEAQSSDAGDPVSTPAGARAQNADSSSGEELTSDVTMNLDGDLDSIHDSMPCDTPKYDAASHATEDLLPSLLPELPIAMADVAFETMMALFLDGIPLESLIPVLEGCPPYEPDIYVPSGGPSSTQGK